MKITATSLVTGGGIALTSDDQLITVMLRPGDVKYASDEMRHSRSIREALSLGLITVEMDYTDSSDFVDFGPISLRSSRLVAGTSCNLDLRSASRSHLGPRARSPG